MNALTYTPWRFDGHGVNDAQGNRLATLTESLKFLPEADDLGHALAAGPELLKSLETLMAHVLHYASLPHASPTAAKDAAEARALIAKVRPRPQEPKCQ